MPLTSYSLPLDLPLLPMNPARKACSHHIINKGYANDDEVLSLSFRSKRKQYLTINRLASTPRAPATGMDSGTTRTKTARSQDTTIMHSKKTLPARPLAHEWASRVSIASLKTYI